MILGHPDFSVSPAGLHPSGQSLFVHFSNGKILLNKNELPLWKAVQPSLPQNFLPFELAHAGKTAIFSAHPHTELIIPEKDGLRYQSVDIFRSMPLEQASLIASCLHLWRWYESNRFCGRCASPLMPDPSERALRCTACGNLLFPAIAPAVIVAITCGDRILLAKNHRHQHYALIAGYVEVGETLEHALRREVMEEVGLEIHDIRYLGDQPWGISGSQMFAFHAKADDTKPIRIQASELKDARWFCRKDVESLPHKVSIAYELIERFRNGTLEEERG